MIDRSTLFRLPWTLADNAMTWLEPTRQCNIRCDACFVENSANTHKSLDQLRKELEILGRLRRCDAMLIAGGEPLVHPDIIEIVRLVKSFGNKPVLITNGVGLEQRLALELKKAGAFGFTFHIDSHQARPGWTGKSEQELNDLREHYANLVHDLGGLSCAFNTTVFPDTLASVADIVRWAVAHADRVNIMTLICVRMGETSGRFDHYAGGRKIDIAQMPYTTESDYRKLTAEDIFREVTKVVPGLRFCAYLGGTVLPHSLKWVIGTHLVSGGDPVGNLGSRAMEMIQNGSHLFRRRYLAYSSPATTLRGKSTLLLGLIDPELRRAGRRFLSLAARDPRRLFRRLHIQNISVVQPVDILDNGEQDTCDGCPNKTIHDGALVAACRLEEYRHYGGPVTTMPKAGAAGERET
jgi:hypothetical protein